MLPYLLVLLVPFYCLCFAQGQDKLKVEDLQKSVIPENIDIHLLCEARTHFQRDFLFQYARPHKVLSWCMNWDQYVDNLAVACLYEKHILVVLPNNRWKRILEETTWLREAICPHVNWLQLATTNVKNSSQERTHEPIIHSILNMLKHTAPKMMGKYDAPLYAQAFSGKTRSWTQLSGKKVRIGCVVYNKTGVLNSCESTDGKAFTHALRQLNVSSDITPVQRGAFAAALGKNQADIVVIAVGLTEDRYKDFDFSVHKFGQAVYYVQKKWKHRADFFLGVLPWTSLLALSTLLSVGSFAILNLCRGRRPLRDLGRVVLALIATTMSFTSPLHRDHARSSSGRVVMAFWMLACFSLATYTRSLLTASLTAKPTWEADDTFEEMLPKLQQGRLLPCAEKNSFFHVLLSIAAGNSSDVVDVMASAARRSGNGRRRFTGSFESCIERTRRGTHVLFSEGVDFCKFSRYEEAIVIGEKPIRSLIGGFPIRRGYSLRAELILLAHRIFETGWDIRFSRTLTWNCSGVVGKDEADFGAAHLFYLYGAFCTVSILALLLELLYKRLFDEKKEENSSRWATSTVTSYGHAPVNFPSRRRRIGRRVLLRRVETLDRILEHPVIRIRPALQ